MKAIRQLATFGEGYGLLNMVLVLDMALMIVAVWRYPKIPLWQLIVLIILWILLCICNMAKVLFFIMFITVIYALYERKKISLRSIIISSGTLFLLFYLFTLSREGGDFETEETLLDFLGTYVLSGSVAYGHVNPNISEFFGQNVFWVLSYYGTKFFGLQEVPMIQFQDFINVPVETNVYTLFRPYFADFGQIGVAMAAFIYGMVSGVIYRFARFGNAFAKCFYTYIIYILVMQFFDDVVVSSLLLITQLAFLLYILVQKSVTIKI